MRSIRGRRLGAGLVLVATMLVTQSARAQEAGGAPSEDPLFPPDVDVDVDLEDEIPGVDESAPVADPDEASDEVELEVQAEPEYRGVETLTVTAQKRTENLQEVPAAVTAISGGRLDEAGFYALQDVQSLVPNLHFGQENGEAKITIRGVSNAQGTDQSTAVHIDGVYQNRPRSVNALTFFDLQRIEVLRGPQGTLYGRNATGGAMNIISNPPSPDFELFGDVQIGNFNQKLARGVLNVPIVEDVLAIRASGFYEDRDGYQKNFCEGRPDDNADPNTPNCNRPPGPDNDADDADDYGIRGQVRLTPGDRFEATLRANYARKRGVGYALKRQGPLPETVDLGQVGEQPIYAGATENPTNLRHVFNDTTGRIDIETINGNGELAWTVPALPLFGETRLKVIGSYSQFDDFTFSDQDYSDLFISSLNQTFETREWVAEINWSSDSDGDWGWLLGFFHLGTDGLQTVDAPSNLRIFLAPPPADPLNVEVPFFQTFGQSAYSVAAFTNVWWQVTDKLKIEAGLRYSHDWKTSNLQADEVIVLGAPVFVAIDDPRSDDWGLPSGSISLDYQIAPEVLVYGRFATGYKSGALNNEIAILGGVAADPACDPDPTVPECDGLVDPPNANPENILALEGGLKNTLLDDRLLLNLTLFHYWYSDLQVSQLFESQNIVENAAEARVFGIELESTWRPVDPLTLTAQFAYLSTVYTSFDRCFDAKDIQRSINDPPNCTGNRLSRAPRFSGTLLAMYAFDLDRFGTLTPFGQIYFSDEVFFRPTNEPEDTQSAYFLLNFRLMWQTRDGRLGIDLFVDNALDEDVATTKIVGSTLLGAPLLDAYDRPRTAGVRVNLAW